MDKLLALGSLVLVKINDNLETHVMIAGYYPIDKKTGVLNDYIGILYPAGLSLKDTIIMFSKSAIQKVVTEGYLDEKATEFVSKMPETLDEFKAGFLEKLAEKVKEAKDNGEKNNATNDKGSAEPFG